MPGGSAKKQSAGSESAQKNSSNSSVRSGCSTPGSRRARKRKRCVVRRFSESDLESELEDCDMDDAVAIEKKLRKVAEDNNLSDDEMRRLLQKFVKNEHILALVTLKAEDELARERKECEQPTIIITDTPSVPKLTRAKARELNKTPGITLSKLTESGESEIATLIQEELHSDEDDEEYVFKEEDFASDEDPNTTTSDMDSNPRTPQTPLSQAENGDSPVKLTTDGCFKIPVGVPKATPTREDVRIAARTRSKLCLQQTAIEDLESEFVPPDAEKFDFYDMDLAANDEDWMQFLNDFTKPLNSSFINDDDDPINDPEYIAAEKIPEDAEELRNINIPKNELTELVAELFEGLINEGVSLESVELDTPQKFLQNSINQTLISDANNISMSADQTDSANDVRNSVGRQLNFDNVQTPQKAYEEQEKQQPYISDAPALVPVNNSTQNCYSFQPNIMSTPASSIPHATTESAANLQVPIAYSNSPEQAFSQVVTLPPTTTGLNTEPEWIAVKIPGQVNSYQLARVVPTANALSPPPLVPIRPQGVAAAPSRDTRYSAPYDTNFTWEYISIQKHVYTEYKTKFEHLRSIPKNTAKPAEQQIPSDAVGFTKFQHDILQQQLRIHVQMLTQTFVQTYSHPNYWKFSPKVKDMLMEMEQRAKNHATFRAWNLKAAMKLIREWEEELKKDTEENREMMKFMHREIQLTNHRARQILRFPERIMDLVLNSKVFMYPQYLPRIPFTSRLWKYEIFAPSESQLIARGLERHIQRIRESGERISKKTTDVKKAALRLAKDTIFGKSARRVWVQVKRLMNADYYNPVKYYFEHKHAPPVEHVLITFENGKVLPPKSRYEELPLAWKTHLDNKRKKKRGNKASESAGASYLQFVREALGEEIDLPDSCAEAVTPNGNGSAASSWFTHAGSVNYKNKTNSKNKTFADSVTINVNYNFSSVAVTGANAAATPLPALPVTSSSFSSQLDYTPLHASPPALAPLSQANTSQDFVSFNFDWRTKTLQPITAEASVVNSQLSGLSTANSSNLARDSHVASATQARRKLRYHPNSAATTYTPRRLRLAHFSCLRRSKHPITRQTKQRRQLRKRFLRLLNSYRANLHKKELPYKEKPLILRIYRHFRALELYTNLLGELKMACRNAANAVAGGLPSLLDEEEVFTSHGASTATQQEQQQPQQEQQQQQQEQQQPQQSSTLRPKFILHTSQSSYFGKRTRAQVVQQQQQSMEEDVNAAGLRSKKASRQEENFRHMLLPDTPEDANRKDAIYAFNFYEKVEEAFKASNRPEDCKRFNHILKTFDPLRDKVSDLYYKLERLFLPEHPELAEVFLTFLLPSEAAEIGKFFEHFMINNMTTFINKLNIYFHKQPAQIRKIYNCLAELAEDTEVTIKKVEAKILPLLKGNQFLIDWFLQQFAEAKPPERIFTATEHVNLKESEIRPHLYESLNDPHEAATSWCEAQPQQQQAQQLQQLPTNQANHCQLRYINGRIFYGHKMTLPAKLSFMAATNARQPNDLNDCDMEDLSEQQAAMPECVHGIREYGEQRLAAAADKEAAAAAATNTADCNSDDNERSEEEDVSKALIIDTATEDDSNSSLEPCDDATLRAHAMRLNPAYYGSTCFAAITSTPNAVTGGGGGGGSHGGHHTGAKRSLLNFNDDGKAISPRKPLTPGGNANATQTLSPNINATTTTTSPAAQSSTANTEPLCRDRRKSPLKKSRSPLRPSPVARTNTQPMVVVYERNSAIACAKKLKSLIAEEDDNDDSELDNKDRLGIVAAVKANSSGGSLNLDSSKDISTDSAMRESLQEQQPRVPSPHTPPLLTVTKVEQIDNSDDMEFIPETAEVKHMLTHEEGSCGGGGGVGGGMDRDMAQEQQQHPTLANCAEVEATQQSSVSPHENYTEDCKLDVVATLVTSTANADATHTAAMRTAKHESSHSTSSLSPSTSQATAATAWTREEDKLILIEMKLSAGAGIELEVLFERMRAKLPARSLTEIKGRYRFLMDFLSKLQGK